VEERVALTQPIWQLVVTDYGNDPTPPTQQGVLSRWSDLSGRILMNGVSTCSFAVSSKDPLFAWLRNNDALIKLYRKNLDGTRTLLFHGPAWTLEETGAASGVSLRVNCVDPMYRLNKARTYGGFLAAISGTTEPRGTWAYAVLSELRGNTATGIAGSPRVTNAWIPGDIQPLGPAALYGTDITINAEDYNTLWDVWTAGGLDWKFVPDEAALEEVPNMPTPGITTRMWDLGNPWISELMGVAASCAFRYGHGSRNVVEYSRVKSYDTMATEAWTRRADGTIASSVVTPTHGGALSAHVPTDDIANLATVGQLLTEHTTVRSNPREVYTLTPKAGGPEFRRDFDLGDTFPFSAKIGDDMLFDGEVRCYGVELEVGAGGAAVTKPIVVNE
jgi:hypothetical protein